METPKTVFIKGGLTAELFAADPDGWATWTVKHGGEHWGQVTRSTTATGNLYTGYAANAAAPCKPALTLKRAMFRLFLRYTAVERNSF